MEIVIISDFLKIKVKNLLTILYKSQYFGYLKTLEKYVYKIVDFIQTTPSLPLKKNAKIPNMGCTIANLLLATKEQHTISHTTKRTTDI